MERRPFEFQIRDREQYDNLSGSLVSNVPLSCWTMAEGGERGRGGDGGEKRRRWGDIPRDCRKINTVFFLHGRRKRGAKTKARTSYTASVLMTVKSWPCGREARLGSSKTDDDVSSESIVGIEKRVGSIKRGVGGRRREEAVARG